MRPNVYSEATTTTTTTSDASTYVSGATGVATDSDDGVLTVSPSELPAVRGNRAAATAAAVEAQPKTAVRPAGSLYVDARLQTDQVTTAERQAFNQQSWWQWVSARVIQHLMGEAMWVELDPAKFAMLKVGNGHYAATRTELDVLQTRLSGDDGRDLGDSERQALEERLATILNKLLA